MDMMLLALSAEHPRRRSSMSLASAITEYEDRIEELPEAELLAAIDQAKTKTSILQQENIMFECFLARTNKRLLNGLQQQLDQKGRPSLLSSKRLLAAASSMLSSSGQTSHRSSDTISSPVPSGARSSSIFKMTTVVDQVPRLSISQKFELVGQELEEVLAITLQYRARYSRRRGYLMAELENVKLMLQELTDSLARFHSSLADPRTSAKKFIKILEGSIKSVDFKIQRLQLRINALRQQYRMSQKQLLRDMEFGSSMGPADFEELNITNKKCATRFTEQQTQLLKLSELAGQYTMRENDGYLSLKQKLMELKLADQELHNKQVKLDKAAEHMRQMEEELASGEKNYIVLKTICETYQIPDTMAYLKKKAEIEDLQRQLKTWQRKNRVQHATLKMNTQRFQRLMLAEKSQNSFGQSTSIAGRCSVALGEGDVLCRKSRITMQDAVQMVTSSTNKTRGIAVA